MLISGPLPAALQSLIDRLTPPVDMAQRRLHCQKLHNFIITDLYGDSCASMATKSHAANTLKFILRPCQVSAAVQTNEARARALQKRLYHSFNCHQLTDATDTKQNTAGATSRNMFQQVEQFCPDGEMLGDRSTNTNNTVSWERIQAGTPQYGQPFDLNAPVDVNSFRFTSSHASSHPTIHPTRYWTGVKFIIGDYKELIAIMNQAQGAWFDVTVFASSECCFTIIGTLFCDWRTMGKMADICNAALPPVGKLLSNSGLVNDRTTEGADGETTVITEATKMSASELLENVNKRRAIDSLLPLVTGGGDSALKTTADKLRQDLSDRTKGSKHLPYYCDEDDHNYHLIENIIALPDVMHALAGLLHK